MPRLKKITVSDKAEIQPIIPQEAEFGMMIPVSTSDNGDITPNIQAPLVKISKKEFKQLHIKDTYWLENDIYQTIADMTDGKKGAKALIINQALKDYLNKNNIEIKPLRVKEKKN
ncbi:MAG: hypothetical protein H6Q68_2859 [Firmicutes bacterium]|nr:hypothetical protein [Bacillota bacterium]